MGDDLPSRVHDIREALAEAIEQSRSAGHRVPQHAVDLVAVHVADDQYLEVFHVHVEHAGGSEAQRLQDAVRGGGAVAARQRESVCHHVRIETDRPGSAPAAFGVVCGEVFVLALGG